MSTCPDQKALCALIESAGPVPFELKAPYYEQLLADKTNHATILSSLYHSAHDVYGKIDRKKALEIVAKLDVNLKSDEYRLLKKKLG